MPKGVDVLGYERYYRDFWIGCVYSLFCRAYRENQTGQGERKNPETTGEKLETEYSKKKNPRQKLKMKIF